MGLFSFEDTMLDFKEYRRTIAPQGFCSRVEARKLYKDYIQMNKLPPAVICGVAVIDPNCFGDCKQAPTPIFPAKTLTSYGEAWNQKQEQGNNPMRTAEYTSNSTAAYATVAAVQSDEAIQRDYLMKEFAKFSDSWNDPKYCQLSKLFNLSAPKYPTGSQALLDAFKNGEFTVDQAKVDKNTALYAGADNESYDDDDGSYIGSKFYGITFTGLPVADRKGYDAAVAAYEKAKIDTKRKIIVGSPAEGLAALIALEAWMPSTAPTTTTVQ